MFSTVKTLFSTSARKQYGRLSIYNRFSVFHSQFHDIPRKISAYLRTDSSSGENMWIMRGFYNIFNINDLYLRTILSHCEKHHFGLRNRPFQELKQAISHPNMGFIATRNSQYQKAKRTFPDYIMGYVKRRCYTKCPVLYII